jgi:hypothetical protein
MHLQVAVSCVGSIFAKKLRLHQLVLRDLPTFLEMQGNINLLSS